ncbi:hypothetical protein E2320_005576, partial [Naja naja]
MFLFCEGKRNLQAAVKLKMLRYSYQQMVFHFCSIPEVIKRPQEVQNSWNHCLPVFLFVLKQLDTFLGGQFHGIFFKKQDFVTVTSAFEVCCIVFSSKNRDKEIEKPMRDNNGSIT